MAKRFVLLDMPDELAGEHVVVRPYRDEDAKGMHDAIAESQAHLEPWMPWYDKHPTLDDTREYVRRAIAQYFLREDFPMGMFDRESGLFVGGSGLHVRDWAVPSFEIGYWIRKSQEGKGYVTESVRLLSRLAFEHLGANRLFVRMNAANERSKAVPERLGFIFEGRLRNAELDAAGRPADFLMYSLIPDEYLRLRHSWR